MKLGTELLLKEDSFGSKKGDKLLYLRHCTDSGYSCVEAIVMDEHYKLFLKEWDCGSLEEVYQLIKDNSLTPFDFNQFVLRFNTIKPFVREVLCLENLLLEEQKLTKKLEKIKKLKEGFFCNTLDS